MALEAVVYQQDQLFPHSGRDFNFYSLLAANFADFPLPENPDLATSVFPGDQTENCFDGFWTGSNSNSNSDSIFPHFTGIQPSPENNASAEGFPTELPVDLAENQPDTPSPAASRAKRRRSRSRKNKEEIESQRMTHIAVERNRRKQMNEYLSILRSLMPESYVRRGDQASIIGGAINFVKELEQRLQFAGGKRETAEKFGGDNRIGGSVCPLPFSQFFTFPQYSASPTQCDNSVAGGNAAAPASGVADIEVTVVETHANLKIRMKRQPKQLLKVVSGLQALHLTILHLNVSTVEQIVLYSLSVKVEEDCKLSSVDEIATAVYEMLGRIQEEYFMN